MSGISALGGLPQGMMRSFAPPSFSSLDNDSSGGISLEELKSGSPGSVSSAQSDARAEKLFSKMDSDGDGAITGAEKDAFDSEMAQRMSEMRFSTQLIASGGGPEGSSKPSIGSLSSDIIDALDGNSDSTISLEEFSASDVVSELDTDQVESLFTAMDADGSGSIDESELSSFLESNKPSGPPMGPGGGKMAAGGPPPPPPSEGISQSASGSETDDETSSVALGVLSAALSSYASSSSASSNDYWASIMDALDTAA